MKPTSTLFTQACLVRRFSSRGVGGVVPLFTVHHHTPSTPPRSPPGPPNMCVFIHGLLGSSTNFRTIQLATSKHRPTLSLDLRNHGKSPHTSGPCTLDELALDVAHALETHRGGLPCDILGHSLGGKVAMRLAQLRPTLLRTLVVVDIAPMQYDMGSEGWKSVQGVVHAASSLDPSRYQTRGDIDRALAALVPEPGVRSFVAQNLVTKEGGGYAWRLGWGSILASMGNFASWPVAPPVMEGREGAPHPFQTHVIRGSKSSYVKDQHLPLFQAQFPGAQVHTIDAGHWVHAENPKDFWKVLAGIFEMQA